MFACSVCFVIAVDICGPLTSDSLVAAGQIVLACRQVCGNVDGSMSACLSARSVHAARHCPDRASGRADQQRLRYIDIESLPQNPPARFRALFAIKPRFTFEELAPLVEDLAGPGQSVAQLLVKHTRAVDVGGGAKEYALK